MFISLIQKRLNIDNFSLTDSHRKLCLFSNSSQNPRHTHLSGLAVLARTSDRSWTGCHNKETKQTPLTRDRTDFKLVLCYKYRPAHHQHLSFQRLGGSHAVSGKISFVLTSDSHRLSRYCPVCWWPPRPSWWSIPMAPLLPSIQTTPRPPRSTSPPWPRQDQSSTPTPLTPRTWQSHTWQLLSTTVGLGGFGSLHLIISSLELFSL